VPGSLSLGIAHRQPETISRCISSPSTCAASGNRCASRRAVVVLPSARVAADDPDLGAHAWPTGRLGSHQPSLAKPSETY
jgi:hypothetical protein